MIEPVVIGNAQLYLGDCRDILPTLPKVDAVITDPPYGIALNTDYTRFKPGGISRAKRIKQKRYPPIRGDAETFDPSLLLAIGPALIFGANNFQTALPTGRWLVWDKRRPDGTHFVSQAELAWCSKGRGVEIFQHCWQGFARASENSEHYHPTQKPIALMQHCIGMLGKPETVCDPYMGAGSTGVACINLGLRFIGCEIDPRYFDIACRRIEDAQRQSRMFT